MIRGTTPTLTFTLPFTVENVNVLYLAFSQDNTIILTKSLGDMQIQDNIATITLTQEETLLFQQNVGVEMQVRCKFNDGTAVASNIVRTSANRILQEGVI